MTDDAFKELINLYLDGELSPGDEERLNAEIHASPERSRQFHEACRLQDAMQMVLDPQALQPKDLEAPLPWGRIILGLSVAASLAVGAMLLVQSFVVNDGVDERADGIADPIQHFRHLRRVEVQRYVALQKHSPNSCSLAAQLRLVGLMPEMTPADRQLRPVQCSAVVRRRVIVMRDLEWSDTSQAFRATIDAPHATEVYAFPVELEKPRSGPSDRSGAGGFEATLVSF